MSFVCECGYFTQIKDQNSVVHHMAQCTVYEEASVICNMMDSLQIWNLNVDALLIKRAELQVQIERIDNILLTRNDYNQLKQQISDQILPCQFCKKDFDANKQFEIIWYLEQCFHLVCKGCFVRICNEQYVAKSGRIKCNCGIEFTSQDIIQVMGQEKYLSLVDELNMNNENLVRCINCNGTHFFEQGNENEIIKDQEGKAISGEQLTHYIFNRFKCPQCHTEQCKSCKNIPYHFNMTCQQAQVHKEAKKCRLCDSATQVDLKLPEALQAICKQKECQEAAEQICQKKLNCGHFCQGTKDAPCLPCLNENCSKDQNEDDYCNICFTEALKSQCCVISRCGHIFHLGCIKKRLEAKWNGPRIVFNFLMCPLCKQDLVIKNEIIHKLIAQGQVLIKEVQVLCMERLKLEQRLKDKELNDASHPFYQKPLEYAMNIFCYYECFTCKKPYFGGLKNCQAAAEQDNRVEFKKEDLICTKCCPIISMEDRCPKHGADYIDFKCRFCCSLALWFCHGTTHYCDPCHSNIKPKMEKKCLGPGKCPLGFQHKPNGQEQALGCSICRAERIIKQ